ncbi:DUF6179 domain-containing protein [Anaerocolumna xylanovorans]|uniref:Uncharacterized protein n=1 Tax=Anaerocolumna xylanovorans DSM 12503 TaxID=1121345 RepID=A0A1M7XWV7_9FIRM|nr:DUF6179 domain-containing protein [Anaerocolumna xylanovorans]SHO43282.1 hypothetical protein SAMN02745217_00154 [Anaerocolumna xylanovorans DSM 12503]
MEYEMEELLPLVEKLTFKYTSGDSSSVTYETARMLMEAILYCIREYDREGSEFGIRTNEKTDAATAYKLGFEAVTAKVYKTKELYHTILEEFEDYGCRNLRNTVIEGMPAFFLWYDPKFKPQDHLLTLDYPALRPVNDLCGVDAIYQYLHNIKIESDFLKAFGSVQVEELLERVMPDYRNLYYDNISYEVLLTVVGCIAANKPVGRLRLTKKDLSAVEEYFKGDSEETAEMKINSLLSDMFRRVYFDNGEMERYFCYLGREYAVRILNGLRHNSLPQIFYII